MYTYTYLIVAGRDVAAARRHRCVSKGERERDRERVFVCLCAHLLITCSTCTTPSLRELHERCSELSSQVGVSARSREREREREGAKREREGEREGERERGGE